MKPDSTRTVKGKFLAVKFATFLTPFFTGIFTLQLNAADVNSAQLSGVSSTGASVDIEVSFVSDGFDGLTEDQKNAIESSAWWSDQVLKTNLANDLVRVLNEQTDWLTGRVDECYGLATQRSMTTITADILRWDWGKLSWSVDSNVTVDPATPVYSFYGTINWAVPTGANVWANVFRVAEINFFPDMDNGNSMIMIIVSGGQTGYSYQLSRSRDLIEDFVDIGEPVIGYDGDIVLSHQFPQESMDSAFFRVTKIPLSPK